MKRTLFISAIFIAIALVLTFIWTFLAAFISGKKQPDIDSKPLVLVSIEPYAYMVNRIANDNVNVVTVVPPGVDPHNWEPSYKDMNKLNNASVWFTIGEGFEPALEKKLREVNPKLIIFNLNDQVKTLADPSTHEGHHHEFDTHTWLSPSLLITQSRFVTKILEDQDPLNDEVYRDNLQKLEVELKALDASSAKALLPYHGDILVTTHGAYTYYCHDFGIEQIVIEPSSGKEPRMRDITDLVKNLKEEKKRIIGIFIQPQHTNKAAKILEKDLNIPTYMVDPYAENFIETITTLTTIISNSAASGDPT